MNLNDKVLFKNLTILISWLICMIWLIVLVGGD